ncbi:cytochrome c-type biogenesis protein [Neptuniibacter sp. CAU 1671]|uniref:cytochrome c-type biogenesis protein n=1 Tax=Neptuniibacter sp. CAU 1671 TaxID=3032593 RepID=UPI0023DA5019|nr:cytochrome c-type biogenesis protein [Neptuniibacter sp. CAU 1671]MDF2181385.1 cytochrome c-type biogenesis protein CcmH [Neptuniibacter sp. CAU 1671]
MKKLLILLCLLPVLSQAAIDTYEFKDDATRERFHTLVFELRCPKCQNQNLADSNSPIASDLRREIHRMLEEGNNDAEIIDFMVARYGDFVLYRPPVNHLTYVLWYGPFGLLLVGIVVLLLLPKLLRKRSQDKDESHLSSNEADRLNKLLEQEKDQ